MNRILPEFSICMVLGTGSLFLHTAGLGLQFQISRIL
jgi:hypothetical protein